MRVFVLVMILSSASLAMGQPIHASAGAHVAHQPRPVEPGRGYWAMSLKASGYAAIGMTTGALVGWMTDRFAADCPASSLDCGLGPPGWTILGVGVGWGVSVGLFNHFEDFDGSGPLAFFGMLGGGIAGVGIGVGLGNLMKDTHGEWILPTAFSLTGAVFGSGLLHVIDLTRSGGIRAQLAPAPVAQGGMGLHLLGRF